MRSMLSCYLAYLQSPDNASQVGGHNLIGSYRVYFLQFLVQSVAAFFFGSYLKAMPEVGIGSHRRYFPAFYYRPDIEAAATDQERKFMPLLDIFDCIMSQFLVDG